MDFRCSKEHDVSLVEHKNVPCPLPVNHFAAEKVLMIVYGLINHLPVCPFRATCQGILSCPFLLSFFPILRSFPTFLSVSPFYILYAYVLSVCAVFCRIRPSDPSVLSAFSVNPSFFA